MKGIPLFDAVSTSTANDCCKKYLTSHCRKILNESNINSNELYHIPLFYESNIISVDHEMMRKVIKNDVEIKILGSCELFY